jgi:hypothetical protein
MIKTFLTKIFGVDYKTSLAGFILTAYGIADFVVTKSISEFGFFSVMVGLGFISSSDTKLLDK